MAALWDLQSHMQVRCFFAICCSELALHQAGHLEENVESRTSRLETASSAGPLVSCVIAGDRRRTLAAGLQELTSVALFKLARSPQHARQLDAVAPTQVATSRAASFTGGHDAPILHLPTNADEHWAVLYRSTLRFSTKQCVHGSRLRRLYLWT